MPASRIAAHAPMNPPIGAILRADVLQLQTALRLDPGSARVEVCSLLQQILQVDRAWLLSRAEQSLDDGQYARYAALLTRRLHGEPIAYLLGRREFHALDFLVTPATLIPRPETELLVEQTLRHILQTGACRILDLGTGSGAIALSIAHARPDVDVVAVDASTAALEVARANVRRFALGNVHLLHSHWFSALRGERFDIIVSNPPYVAAGDVHLTRGDLRFEPHAALVSGTDGLDDLRHITAHASVHLNANGRLLLEHGHDQAARVRDLLLQHGFENIYSARDLAGIERMSGGSCAHRHTATG